MESNSKITVLHVSISDSGGGASIAANRLHLLMNTNKDLDSSMLVLIKHTKDKKVHYIGEIKRQLSRIFLYIDKILTINKKRSFGLFSTSIFGVRIKNIKLVKNADVIYIHWINSGFISINEIDRILDTGKPTFLICHDMWYLTGGCHYTFYCDKHQILCSTCHFFKNKLIIDLARYGFNRKKNVYNNHLTNTHFICLNSKWGKQAKKSPLSGNNYIHYVPNILNENKFTPLKPDDGLKSKNKYIILFGALGGKTNQYKGWKYFVEAIKIVKSTFKEKIEIVLFGYPFTNTELKELPFKATSVGLITEEDKMIQLYQQSHIYVFPSLQESFGQTLFEAMACGVPAVSFPIGAAMDLIEHKINGYLAEFKNASDLANGIKFLLENDLDLFSKQARKKITTEFSSKSIIDRHFEIISDSLNSTACI